MLIYAIVREGTLYIDNKLWVPEYVYTKVIDSVYSMAETGHPGLAKTLFHL